MVVGSEESREIVLRFAPTENQSGPGEILFHTASSTSPRFKAHYQIISETDALDKAMVENRD